MPKLIAVFESKASTDIHNLLNTARDAQSLPEGVQEVLGTSVVIEFPRAALFLAKLLVAADDRGLKYRIFEIVNENEWGFQSQDSQENPV